MARVIEEPLPLRWMRAHGFTELTPWRLIGREDERDALSREYRAEVSGGSQRERDIYPFARRQDMDDIAGFVVRDGIVSEEVLVVHLTWRGGPEVPGYPSTARLSSFWQWLKTAIDDTAEWCSEDELADIATDEGPPSSPPRP